MIKQLRNRILEVAYRDQMGHIPSALSILDIVWTLYDKVMGPYDQFILSKGHGCMALYAVLEEKGLFDWSTKAQGHPKRGGAILASTGSLGHGLPMALGLAMAKKIKGESGRVFCLIGDGEANEGTTWECALLAKHQKLDNLTLIVDENYSSTRALDMGCIRNKFYEFGWAACSNKNMEMIEKFLHERFHKNPLCVVVETTKGNGVPFMQENSWHNKKLTSEDYARATS